MTRIIGGVARGRAVRTPPGIGTRPTADRVREALFSSLEAELGTLQGVTLLDVYAGSGAVGLEAASRGASQVTCVERDRGVGALIATNAKVLGLDNVRVVTGSASAVAMTRGGGPFDVAFLDPPYDLASDEIGETLVHLARFGWLGDDALVIVERSRRTPTWQWPSEFSAERDRRYGDTILWYGRWEPSPPGSAVPVTAGEES